MSDSTSVNTDDSDAKGDGAKGSDAPDSDMKNTRTKPRRVQREEDSL